MRRGAIFGALVLSLSSKHGEIGFNHFGNEFSEGDAREPTEFRLGHRCIAQEEVDFVGAEVAGVDPDQLLTRAGVESNLVDPPAAPRDFASDMSKGTLDELTDTVSLASREDVIAGLRLLHHTPHAFHILPGMSPVALGIEISDEELVLQAKCNRGDCACNLARYEGLAADWAFMIEQDPIRSMNAIGFAVVHYGPIGKELRGRVWAAGVERCRLALRCLGLAEKFGRGGLKKSDIPLKPENAHGLEDAKGAEPICI